MAAHKKRILVVDDDPEIQQLIKVLLTRMGVETVIADTAAAAVQSLRTEPLPDLLILDLMLPEISGLDLLRQMRARNHFDGMPVLVLSALIDPSTIREALDAGADRYLTKPYIANNLVTIVQDMLTKGRQERLE